MKKGEIKFYIKNNNISCKYIILTNRNNIIQRLVFVKCNSLFL